MTGPKYAAACVMKDSGPSANGWRPELDWVAAGARPVVAAPAVAL